VFCTALVNLGCKHRAFNTLRWISMVVFSSLTGPAEAPIWGCKSLLTVTYVDVSLDRRPHKRVASIPVVIAISSYE
jgi:hypothetical protein